jgi:hypothetical protein
VWREKFLVRPAGNRTGDLSLMRRVWYHKTTASALPLSALAERFGEAARCVMTNLRGTVFFYFSFLFPFSPLFCSGLI